MIQNTVKHLKRIGKEQGRQLEREEIAKKLKQNGMEIKEIEKITTLSQTKIQKL